MRRWLPWLALSVGLGLATAPAFAQTPSPVPPPSPAPAGGMDRLIVSPEYATSINGIWPRSLRQRVFGVPDAPGARTLTARLDLLSASRASPILSAGLLLPGGQGQGKTGLVLGGARLDLLGERARRRVQPYVLAGGGVVLGGNVSGRFVPSLGGGARLLGLGDYAPRAELRYERYYGRDYAMLGIGVNLLLTHHGPAALR